MKDETVWNYTKCQIGHPCSNCIKECTFRRDNDADEKENEMCKFCEIRKWDPNHQANNSIYLTYSQYVGGAEMGIVPPQPEDTENRIAIWTTDEDGIKDYYYPKFCPECGRKLI